MNLTKLYPFKLTLPPEGFIKACVKRQQDAERINLFSLDIHMQPIYIAHIHTHKCVCILYVYIYILDTLDTQYIQKR